MIKNFGERLQNTWQNLRGTSVQPDANDIPQLASGQNAAGATPATVRASNERSVAARLRQRLRAPRAMTGFTSAAVHERDIPERRHSATPVALLESVRELSTEPERSAPVASASSTFQRPPLVSSHGGLSTATARTFARQPPQPASSIVPTAASAQPVQSGQPPLATSSFNHDFAQYDLDFPFQERFGFESEEEAHEVAKAHGFKQDDYRLKTESSEDPPVTMTLRSTEKLKQNWKRFPFDTTSEFDKAKIQLSSDAALRMRGFVPSTSRPAVRLSQKASVQTLFKTVLGRADALVIGECHSDFSSKKAVIDTMPTLRAAGATHFFLEHVPADTFKKEIAEYNAAPRGAPLPRVLENYLDKLDSTHMFKPGLREEDVPVHDAMVKKYGFKAMTKAIHDGGMELCCIDREISYHVAPDFKGYGAAASQERGRTFNYLADQQRKRLPQGAKSVWFIGEAHANTFEGVPGQAELHNGIAVVISDRHKDSPGIGLMANVKNSGGHEGLNPDLVMTVDLAQERALALRELQQS